MQKIDSRLEFLFSNYIFNSPIFNTYIIGNYYKYGLSNQNVEFFTSNDQFYYILMRYHDSFVFYSNMKLSDYHLHEITNKIIECEFDVVSGEKNSVEQIIPNLNNYSKRSTTMLSLSKTNIECIKNYSMKRLYIDDAPEVFRLFSSINEFKNKYTSKKGLDKTKHVLKEDVVYGSFENKILTGIIVVTALSNKTCMLTDICVGIEFRHLGIAKNNILFVASELFSSGIEFINLYADNPSASRLYRNIGFSEIGEYVIIRKTES